MIYYRLLVPVKGSAISLRLLDPSSSLPPFNVVSFLRDGRTHRWACHCCQAFWHIVVTGARAAMASVFRKGRFEAASVALHE
jgi:hypothetical protein